MANLYIGGNGREQSDPISSGVAVSLASDTSFTGYARLLFVGTGGNVKVDCAKSGTAITFKNVPAGTFLPVYVIKVYSTANGTTATDLVACW